jgi:hypothetical protein
VPVLLRNGDWRYGLFDGQCKASKNLDEPQCLACHKPRVRELRVNERRARKGRLKATRTTTSPAAA